MSDFWSILSNNSLQVDSVDAEEKLRQKYPYLLHRDERVELAFKSHGEMGRDKQYLTTSRILLKDGKGIGAKRRNYKSIPYESIQAFSVETAGAFLDTDVELKLWCKGGLGRINIDFSKGQVDIFMVKQFFNNKIFNNKNNDNDDDEKEDITSIEYMKKSLRHLAGEEKIGSMESFFNFLGDDGVQLDPQVVETRLKTQTPVLLLDKEERVLMAFKCARDTFVLTNRRFLDVDVKGWTGKCVEFFTMKWECVSAFAVETAGKFERDTDVTLHTNIWSKRYIQQDLSKSRADLFGLQKILTDMVLGKDKEDDGGYDQMVPGINLYQGHQDPGAGLFQWGGSNARPLDAVEVDRMFHTSPPILQKNERVEMAFKGRRDLFIFTTKRILDVDVKGLSGRKVEYTSLPWSRVVGFGVQTAGKHLDLDCEAMVWTDIMFQPGSGDDDPPEPAMSYLEFDFNKNVVDIIAIKKYLSVRCMDADSGTSVPIPSNLLEPSSVGTGFEKWLSKIGQDQRTIDPTEINRELHTNTPVLLDDETVVMAFMAGRDMTCFTNRRILGLDTKGWSGKKIEYVSIPYASIRAFSAESAGAWDRDAELCVYTANTWSLSRYKQDFRKGKADIVAINKFLSAIVLNNLTDVTRYTDNTSGPNFDYTILSQQVPDRPMGGFLDWVLDNTIEIDAGVTNSQLHHDPPILLSDEVVEKAWRENRDLWVYTNHRVVIVDVQGLRGTKVEYESIPLMWVTGFAVETAGHLDRDAEVFVYSDIYNKSRKKQSILVRKGNVFDMHEWFTNKILYKE